MPTATRLPRPARGERAPAERATALSTRTLVGCALAVLSSGCAGAAVGGGSAGGGDAWTEAQWRAIHETRPEPVSGAAAVTLSEISFLGERPWPATMPVGMELAVSELVTANLLRRRDVRFVERRRFAAAAAADRRGAPPPPGRPPTGVSPGADLGVGAVWIPTSEETAAVEIRLVELRTGDVRVTDRLTVSRDADAVALARSVVVGALTLLEEIGRRPEWDDPRARAGTDANAPPATGVSEEALRWFLAGLDAEETWRWELARRGYQQALEVDPDFYEARVALRRTARLRLGGTLGES